MHTYILAFIFYTLAMIGVMFGAFIIYKKVMMSNRNNQKNMIKVLDTMPLAPKKTLYVIKVRNEKFLIASDATSTTFLSKLTDEVKKDIRPVTDEQIEVSNFQQDRLNRIQKQFMDLYNKTEEEEKVVDLKEKPTRKEMIKKLLKDLNSSNSSATGSY